MQTLTGSLTVSQQHTCSDRVTAVYRSPEILYLDLRWLSLAVVTMDQTSAAQCRAR